MHHDFPTANFVFESPENVFEKTFANRQAAFLVKLHLDEETDKEQIASWFKKVKERTGYEATSELSYDNYLAFVPDFEKIMIYNLSLNNVYASLRSVFAQNKFGSMNTMNEVVPVVLSTAGNNFMNQLQQARVMNKKGVSIPLMSVLEMQEFEDFKKIVANLKSEYVPYELELDSKQALETEAAIKDLFAGSLTEFSFGGSIFQFRQYLKELMIVLGISLLLLYFILAAQFECLLQPLIILLEIPIDIAGALLLLILFGGSLNIMSAIGIIVMTGIIINDSILKIDTINRLRRQEALSILEAIHEGGKRRLRPIIMTSLTTILAVLPVMFASDLGSALQSPLALAIAGGLGVGTLVSLFFIPLAYWFIYRKSEKKELLPA